jgi:hypothetical protein
VPDLDMDALLSGSQVAMMAGVSLPAVCNWVARGYLPVATDGEGREIRDPCGRPRYRLRDALKADVATSTRGEARGEKMAAMVARRITEAA